MRIRMASVRALRGRRIIAVLAVPAAAATLAGCASFQSPPTASQDNVIGAADIHTAICLGGFGMSPDAGAFDPIGGLPGNPTTLDASAGSADTTTPEACNYTGPESTGQVLVGYLVPDGSTAPQTLSTSELGGLTFTQDAAYAQQLAQGQGDAPASLPGHHWVGYISNATTIDQNADGSSPVIHLDAAFGLPASADGSPYSGPFFAETVVGDRVADHSDYPPVDPGTDTTSTTTSTTSTVQTTTTETALAQAADDGPDHDASRSVDCTQSDDAVVLSGATVYGTDCAEDSASVTLDTRDLRVIAPQPVTVAAGQTATLPFTMAYAGSADPSATFGLTASGDQPAGSPSAADAHYTPSGAGNATESVTDAIPASTAPGTYHVTLTAAGSQPACADATQCSRSATATVVVTPASSTGAGTTGSGTTAIQNAPKPRAVAAKKLRFSARLVSVGRPKQHGLFVRGWRLKLYCNQACVVHTYSFVYHGGYYHGRKLPGVQRPTSHIVIGKRLYNLARAGTKSRYVHLSPAAVTSLTRADIPHFRLTVRLYATDANGGQRTRTVRRQVWIIK